MSTKIPSKVNIVPFNVSTTETAKKLRSRVSNFHVTMSTNVRWKGSEKSLGTEAVKLQDATNDVFSSDETKARIVLFPKGGEWDISHIISDDITIAVEIGTNVKFGSRVHLHVKFKIRHRSYLRLDPAEIKIVMNEALTRVGSILPIHYVHVKCHPPDLEDYVVKDAL